MGAPPSNIDPNAMQQAALAQPPQQQGGVVGGIESLLSHPLVQGAIAAYLGAIGSPRLSGLGGAVSRGGLIGLDTVGQAEAQRARQQQLQNEAAQRQAELGLRGQQVGLEGKRVDLEGQKLAAAEAGRQPIGKEAAARILKTNPKLGIDADTLATFTPDMVRRELDAVRTTGQRDPLVASEIARNQALTTAAGARTKLGEEELALKEQLGEKGLGIKEKELASKETPTPKPADPAQRAQRIASVNTAWKKNAPYFESYHPNYQKAHYQALVDAGASTDEAAAMSGYTVTAEPGTATASEGPSGVDHVVNKYLTP